MWVIICAVAAGFVAPPTTVLVLAGLVPTLVALIVDRTAERHAVIAVGTLNFAGVAPSVIALWRDGHTMDAALRLLIDPLSMLVMLGAAAIGWVLYLGVPSVLAVFLTHRNEAEIRRMVARREDLVAEWGPEVAAKD
ncbi:MAG: hypothetical protein V3R98_02330 [Alphaproteobacteria bacterium]